VEELVEHVRESRYAPPLPHPTAAAKGGRPSPGRGSARLSDVLEPSARAADGSQGGAALPRNPFARPSAAADASVGASGSSSGGAASAAEAADTPGPSNPFAGKRKRADWEERRDAGAQSSAALPPGAGRFDALHPEGQLNSGGGSATRRASKRVLRSSPAVEDRPPPNKNAEAQAQAIAAAAAATKAQAQAEAEAMEEAARIGREADAEEARAAAAEAARCAPISSRAAPGKRGKSPSTAALQGGAKRTSRTAPKAKRPAGAAGSQGSITGFFARS
jgi:hypothetical protein